MTARYTVVRSFDKLPDALKEEFEEEYFIYSGSALIKGDEVIFADGRMEPEDATLGRDLRVFVSELNELDKQLRDAEKKLQRVRNIEPYWLMIELMRAYRMAAHSYGFAGGFCPLEVDMNTPEAAMMMSICNSVLNIIKNDVMGAEEANVQSS